jgi:hypothetical protein
MNYLVNLEHSGNDENPLSVFSVSSVVDYLLKFIKVER